MAAAGAPALKLKIRGGPSGDKLLSSGLTKNSTFEELRRVIAAECGVPANQQELSQTYPPPIKVISGQPTDTLAALKIQSGDALLLKQIAAPTPTPAAAATATSAAPSRTSSTASSSSRPTSPPKPKPASLEELQHLQPLTVVPIPNDNSCLFNSLGLLTEGAYSTDLMRSLRETVASIILADSANQYDAAFLGCTKEEYATQMLKSETWGGGIELSILAEYLNVEIAALDVETCHQYLFGTGDTPASVKSKRIYLVYYGVHYDALVDIAPSGQRTLIFSPTDKMTEQRALLAARRLQKEGAFTNLEKFTLRCAVCKTGLKGAREAQEHAKQTSHQQFEEYQM